MATNGIYNIQPVEVKIGSMVASAVKVAFYSSYVPFDETMAFGYTLYSVDGAMLYQGNDVVGQEALSQWGDNDDYIINVMATIAGLVVIW